jgi:protein PhnA
MAAPVYLASMETIALEATDCPLAEVCQTGQLCGSFWHLASHACARYEERMTNTLPPCPECSSTYTYEVDALLTCPECGHEWQPGSADEGASEVRDSVGNLLHDGDTVTVIKDLKVKGSSVVVKVGTKVRGIRLVDGDHDIDCKIPGIGQMGLKSQFVKKVAE